MLDEYGYYALAQVSLVPERLEFVNFGVVLFLPRSRELLHRFSADPRRIKAHFGSGSKDLLELGIEGVKARLEILLKQDAGVDELNAFAAKRVNEFRLTQFQPVAVKDGILTVDALFSELVTIQRARSPRRPGMTRVLREVFVDAQVLGLLDKSPKAIWDPRTGLKIKASFGYQNGAFNLIDGLRVDEDPAETAARAGQRAAEGRVLKRLESETGVARHLIVVGDFAESPLALFDDLSDSLSRDGVTLRRLDQLEPLIADIKEQARLHATH